MTTDQTQNQTTQKSSQNVGLNIAALVPSGIGLFLSVGFVSLLGGRTSAQHLIAAQWITGPL